MAVLVAGQDYVILILVCVITLVITGCSHAFVLTTNNNLQAGFAKVGIYIGQFAVAVQVTVVIQRMDIDGRQIVCNYALDNGVLIFVQAWFLIGSIVFLVVFVLVLMLLVISQVLDNAESQGTFRVFNQGLPDRFHRRVDPFPECRQLCDTFRGSSCFRLWQLQWRS